MKEKYVVFFHFTFYLWFVFSIRATALKFFDVTVFSKEVALILGLVLATIVATYLARGKALMKYFEYPFIFWILAPLPFFFLFMTYRQFIGS
ncbi:hypothetical protein OAK75_13585 [Bacteriovoracales bacterium]|nr:hypothetical protein [Bacteriovoracales bacterium]